MELFIWNNYTIFDYKLYLQFHFLLDFARNIVFLRNSFFAMMVFSWMITFLSLLIRIYVLTIFGWWCSEFETVLTDLASLARNFYSFLTKTETIIRIVFKHRWKQNNHFLNIQITFILFWVRWILKNIMWEIVTPIFNQKHRFWDITTEYWRQ